MLLACTKECEHCLFKIEEIRFLAPKRNENRFSVASVSKSYVRTYASVLRQKIFLAAAVSFVTRPPRDSDTIASLFGANIAVPPSRRILSSCEGNSTPNEKQISLQSSSFVVIPVHEGIYNMKLSLKSIRSSSSSNSSSSSDHITIYHPVRFSLFETFRDFVGDTQDTRQARMELAELQKTLGTKSRREAIDEFVDMVERGCEHNDDRGHF